MLMLAVAAQMPLTLPLPPRSSPLLESLLRGVRGFEDVADYFAPVDAVAAA